MTVIAIDALRDVQFEVIGTPAPQGSTRAFVVGNRAITTNKGNKSQTSTRRSTVRSDCRLSSGSACRNHARRLTASAAGASRRQHRTRTNCSDRSVMRRSHRDRDG